MEGNRNPATELRHLDLTLDRARGLVFRGDAVVHLTPTEFRLLAALLAEPGKICSRQRLTALAIAGGAIVRDRTVDVHIAALRRKLGHPEIIETVRRRGYRLQPA